MLRKRSSPNLDGAINIEVTDAKDVYQLEGMGDQESITVGDGLILGGGRVSGEGYSGIALIIGAGIDPLASYSGLATHTNTWFSFNMPEQFNKLTGGFNRRDGSSNSGAGSNQSNNQEAAGGSSDGQVETNAEKKQRFNSAAGGVVICSGTGARKNGC